MFVLMSICISKYTIYILLLLQVKNILLLIQGKKENVCIMLKLEEKYVILSKDLI